MNQSSWPDGLPRGGNQKLDQVESVSQWFEVYRVSEGTFALLEPKHNEEVISYLILGRERGILFDTGMGIGDIEAEVEALMRPQRVPVIVVNSHSHFDHVGGDHCYDDVWAFDDDCEIGWIERGKTGGECARYLAVDTFRELPEGFDPLAYEILPARVTRRLRHLDSIDLGGRTLSVHHTPGHSPGSICLLDDRDGLLFTGDTVYPGMLYAHFDDSDFDDYLRTARYLAGLLPQVSYLCPAHNEAYLSKDALMRIQEAFEQIAAGEAPYEQVGDARVYRFEGFGVMVPG